MIRLALVIVALGTGLTGAYQAFPTQQRSEPATAPAAAAPAGAAAFGVPVGGPNFAQVPPPGFPASFNVSYTGPDGNFATTCYYTGRFGDVMRWVSVPVSTAEMAGPVEITFHLGIKISQPTLLIPSGAWRVDVGSVSIGNSASPAGGRMQRFGRGPMDPPVGLGYLSVN